MAPEQYERLVSELESAARANPAALRRRVRLLIALGYAYIVFVLAIMLGAVAFLVWTLLTARVNVILLKLAIPLVGLIVVIARSLWVAIEPPVGREIDAGAAPALSARVEEIRAALDAPRADAVLLTDDFNASVTQVPRFGIFGWPRSYLVLGVPLMLALGREQFDAVLAHEFAHLSGSHPKLGLWVFRMSGTWNRLLERLETKRSFGHRLFEPFVRWYAPRLRAHGLVLSRRDEYEADADAGRVTSSRAMAEALVQMEVGDRTMREQHWPQVWRRAEAEPTPPAQPWSRLASSLRETVSVETRREWIGSALLRRGTDETHPALSERLAALGVAGNSFDESLGELVSRSLTSETSAAHHYLGDIAGEMLTNLDESWQSAVARPWSERHEELKSQRALLRGLAEKEGAGETLSPGELWCRASAYTELDEPANAIEPLRALLEMQPENARAHYMLGQILLEQRDHAGREHLERTMTLTSEFTLRCAAALREHYVGQGREEDARAMARLEQTHGEELRLSLAERQDVTKQDSLEPVELSPEYLRRVIAAAEADPRIESVRIARKTTRHLPDFPVIVVLVERHGWRRDASLVKDDALAMDVLAQIDVDTYVRLLVCVLRAPLGWLGTKMEAVGGSLVYRAADA
jgi:Zn-dependent protease with chaperone function